MVTELQQKIFDAISTYATLADAEEHIETIAEECECSDTYVRRMIKQQHEEQEEHEIIVEPPEEEKSVAYEEVRDKLLADEEEDFDEYDFEEELEEEWEDWDFQEEEEPEEERPTIDISTLETESFVTKENVGILLSTPFRITADWTGFDGWMLSEEEKKQLAPMARILMLKYMPDIMTSYFPEIFFGILVLKVVGTKAHAWRAWQAEHKEEEERRKRAEQLTEPEPQEPEPQDPKEKNTDEPQKYGKYDTKPAWTDGRTIG